MAQSRSSSSRDGPSIWSGRSCASWRRTRRRPVGGACAVLVMVGGSRRLMVHGLMVHRSHGRRGGSRGGRGGNRHGGGPEPTGGPWFTGKVRSAVRPPVLSWGRSRPPHGLIGDPAWGPLGSPLDGPVGESGQSGPGVPANGYTVRSNSWSWPPLPLARRWASPITARRRSPRDAVTKSISPLTPRSKPGSRSA